MPDANHYGAQPSDWAHLDLVLGLGEDLLPVVSNPHATISPDSHMKDLGKTPSRYNAQRQVAGIAKWTQNHTSSQEITRWSKENDYGICIQTRRIRAIDVDIADATEAQAVERFIAARFCFPARKRSNNSKFLLAFEVSGELTKRKFKTAHGIVEFLANGQQFIAIGTHPSGVRYEWEGGLPDDFPVLTLEQFEQLWQELVTTFAIEESTTQAASVKHEKLANVMMSDPVAQFLMNTNRVKRAERDGRLHIVCPWELDHTTETGDSSTTYWPAHTGGYANGHFHCLHAHCEARTDEEFLDAIEFSHADEFEHIADGQLPASDTTQPDSGSDDPSPIDDEPTPTVAKLQRFAVHPADHFASGKPPQWIIKGVLPRADLAVLFGESGSGKSFAALDMAVDIAMGTPWRGRTTKQGRVVYIAAEGAGGFRKRLQAVAFQRGLDLSQLNIGVISDAPNLMEKTDALDVSRAIHSAGGADVVIVDTFAQTMPGANENAGEDVGKALSHCKGIHRATGALVMLVHHSGKDSSKGARGWSGLRAAADVELEVVRADEARSLTVTKQKDGEDGAEFAFKLQTVVLGFDDDGEEITSCYVEHGTGTVARVRDRGPKGSTEKMVLSAMSDLVKVDSPFVELHDVKDAVMPQMPHDPESGKRDTRSQRILRAIETLQNAGRIVINGTQLKFAGGEA